MDCLSEGRIQGIVEGGLDSLERAKAREHLENCAECRKLVGHAAALFASADSDSSAEQVERLEPLGPALDPLRPGERVGRYVIEGRLGSGAMGVVYSAMDSLLQRQVALKLLRPSDAGSQLEQARLEREARAASAVKHPGVVAVFDVLSTGNGFSVLVMDRLEGVSLRQHLREQGSLPSQEVQELFSQILEALSAAHRMGIVHRDLKPENVFLTRNEHGQVQVKLLDFGVAKLLTAHFADSAGLTKSGTLVGTPYYMAPEQAFGASDLDQRADLWAVGVMLYEALVGERPVRGENVGQVLHQLAHFDFAGPRARLLEAAPQWEPLISRLMVERAARLGAASDVLDWVRSLGASHPKPAATTPPSAPLTPKKKGPSWAIPILLGVGTLIGLGFASQPRSSAPASSAEPVMKAPLTGALQPGDPSTGESEIPAVTETTSAHQGRSASTATPITTHITKPTSRPTRPSSTQKAAPSAQPPASNPATTTRKPRLLTEPPF